MKATVARALAAVAVAMLAIVLLAAAAGTAKVQQPDQLIILSTVDVKGKTSPCG